MSWISITAADIQNALTAPELSALKSAAKAVSQDGDTILADAIADVVLKVRGYVAGCQRNTLGEVGTIPDELKTAAVALIRDHLFTRLPAMSALNDEQRQKQTDRAYTELKDVAACKIAIVPPETAAESQAAGPSVTLVQYRPRISKRSDLAGL